MCLEGRFVGYTSINPLLTLPHPNISTSSQALSSALSAFSGSSPFSYLEEASGGPPRKYYVITRKGERFLDQLIAEWALLVDNVNSIILGGSSAAAPKKSGSDGFENVQVRVPADDSYNYDDYDDETDGGQTDE